MFYHRRIVQKEYINIYIYTCIIRGGKDIRICSVLLLCPWGGRGQCRTLQQFPFPCHAEARGETGGGDGREKAIMLEMRKTEDQKIEHEEFTCLFVCLFGGGGV